MSGETEMLYPGENTSSEDFKITRIDRTVRGLRIQPQTADAHVAIVGLLSTNLMTMTHEQMERERRWTKDTLWQVRGKFIGLGLPEEAIRVYVPFKVVPTQGSVVALYALETAPRQVGPYMWGKEPRIQPAVTPAIEASLNMVYDLKAREEDRKYAGATAVECEIDVSVWESNRKNKIAALSGINVTLAVDAEGVKEVGGELTLLKARINALDLPKKLRSGTLQKIEIAVKGEVSSEPEGAQRASNNWQVKFKDWRGALKLSLSAEFRIPVIQLKLPIEIEASIGPDGKPEFQLKIKLLEW